MNDKPYRYLVVAGEASGDLHGSNLISALKVLQPLARFSGMGGSRMREAGVETLFGIERMGTVGVIEVLNEFDHYYKVYRTLMKEIASRKYDAVILIDYPTLNLRLAKQGRRFDCPVLFFISPQIWAWRKGRIKDIRESVRKMFVILPFEEKLYLDAGVDAEFLGHPFIDMVHPSRSREESKMKYSLEPGIKTIGILPGSRMNEINSLLGVMVEAAERIRNELGSCQFLLPIADSIDPDLIRERLGSNSLGIQLIQGEAYDVMNICDTVIIASGSATLEAGILGCPMVIVYKLNPLTYWMARLLVKIPLVGLVNIVAGEGVVPELIQDKVTAENISAEVLALLRDPEKEQAVRERLLRIKKSLGEPGVMKVVAKRIADFMDGLSANEKILI
ncbi:MAG TPA: lipid-A-disaccharide synthase [Nitrospinaceae bacterium]|jgi:lipid-A-disaccharide synthase|nr:lipid-A-disaccharide synthase [Nitrospinaceae bacterium]HIK57889.1 lipid-A-disaccharide synthase [Nitrospinaceae bacterium]